jgi:hypothetical protein
MSEQPKSVADMVAKQLELECVCTLPAQEKARVVEAIQFALVDPVESDIPKWQQLVDVAMAGWDLRAAVDRADQTAVDIPASNRDFARGMVSAVVELYSQPMNDRPLPPNVFNVGATKQNVTFLLHGLKNLPKREAYLLGIWLLAVSDPTLADARVDLLRVATR